MTTLHATIPDDLYREVIAQAERERVSPDELVSRSLRASVALPLLRLSAAERSTRADWEGFDRILARVPDATPVPGDEL